MKNKQYGILNPKSLDYLLATIFSLVAVCAVWLGCWITLTKNYVVALEVIDNFVKAVIFDIYSGANLLIALQSVVLYGGFALVFILCLFMICKRKFSSFAGLIAILVSTVAFTFGIGFIGVLFINEILAITVVVLAILFVALQYFTTRTIKLELAYLFGDIYLYKQYNEELGHKKAEKPKEEILEEAIEEEPIEVKEEKDFYFENSNGYDGYTYRNDFVNYNAQIDKLLNDEEDEKIYKGDIDKLKQRKNNDFTFEQKLERTFQVAKDYFAELKAYAEGLGFKSALTKPGETFSYKNTKYAMIDVAGQKGLKVYYKLDINDYLGSPIPLKDMGKVKKYENTPVLLIVKSDLALKRAKKLFDDLKNKYGVEGEVEPKEEKVEAQKVVVKKPEEPQEVEENNDENLFDRKSNHYTFEKKLKMARPEVRKYFVELKAYFESLGFKSALTKSGETFVYKNIKYATITVAGKKGLKIYYKLNAKDYEDSPIPVKYMGEIKKYEKTPILLVVKSDLAIKRAKKLMDDVKSQLDKE